MIHQLIKGDHHGCWCSGYWPCSVACLWYCCTSNMTNLHYSDVIMSKMASQITVVSIIFQPFVEEQIKENIKALHRWPLWGESTGYRWIPLTKGQQHGKCFHLITSSCVWGSTYSHWLKTQVHTKLWPSHFIFQHKSWSTSVRVMASYLFGTKPLPEPLLSDGQLGPQGQIPATLWFKYKNFHKKYHFKMSSK